INRKPSNPYPLCCDVSTGGQEAGHMKIERFADVVPKTAKNFRQFCTGNFGRVPWLKYAGSTFPRIIKDFMIQGGDFVNGDGTGVTSCFALYSPGAICRHSSRPAFTADSGPSTNGCQVFITCSNCDWLDGKQVVFGNIIGRLVVRKIENVPTGPNSKPKLPVVTSQCREMRYRTKLLRPSLALGDALE
uniref:Peptidyl-prolyl cis-trans isomerase n=1 Tax=Panthera tigris altaica TaxID=74533 RepID=A0A8C9M3F0_PANTA